MTPAPSDGLPAIQFVQSVRVPGALGNLWEFRAGSVFVADRTRAEDGAVLWCGTMVIVDSVLEARPLCFTREGSSISVNADVRGGGFARELPPGAVRDFRLR